MENLTSDNSDSDCEITGLSNDDELTNSSRPSSARPTSDEEADSSDNDIEHTGETNQFKRQLGKLLKKVKKKGEFATFGILKGAPSTTVQLNDGRKLYFPLNEEQVEKVKGFFEQSPYGRNTETIDTTVRNSWQISPEDFKIMNSDWRQFIDETLCQRIACELKISSPIKLILYKFLLYEPGFFFKPHRDSEKEDGMFGTLVVQLPSEYEGGELLVTHDGETKKIDFSVSGGANEFSTYFSAFYCDVQHEVLEVKKGYRACLIYNLVSEGEGNSTPIAPECRKLRIRNELEMVLKSWPKAQTKIVHILSHKYTEDRLSFKNLKKSDKELVNILQDLRASAYPLTMVLGVLERHEYGQCKCGREESRYGDGESDEEFYDGAFTPEIEFGRNWWREESRHGRAGSKEHEFDEEGFTPEIDDTWKILWNTIITGYDQKEIASLEKHKIRMTDEELLRKSRIKGVTPDEEDCSGPTGNEEVTLTRTYRRSAIIFWPDERYLNVLAATECSFVTLVQKFLELMEGKYANALKSTQDNEKQIVKNLVETILKKRGHIYFGYNEVSPDQRAKIFQVCVQLGDLELILKFLVAFSGSIGAEIIPQVDQYGWNTILPVLNKVFDCLSKTKAAEFVLRFVQCENISLEAKTILGNLFEILLKDEQPTTFSYCNELQFLQSMLAVNEYFNSSKFLEFIKVKSKDKHYLLKNSAPAVAKFIQDRSPKSISAKTVQNLRDLVEYLTEEVKSHEFYDNVRWKMMNVTLTCKCDDCKELQQFLIANIDKKSFSFRVGVPAWSQPGRAQLGPMRTELESWKRCQHLQKVISKLVNLKHLLIESASGRPTLEVNKVKPFIEKRSNTDAINIGPQLKDASRTLQSFKPPKGQGGRSATPPQKKFKIEDPNLEEKI